MDKASRALRRSGVKLMSLGAGHTDLNVLVSDVKEVKNSTKAFMNAQNIAAQDMMRWAAREENRGIQDVVTQIAELNQVWAEVQNTFTDHLKAYRQMFEMILDGEKQVSLFKANLDECVQREAKVRKELKRAAKRATSHELRVLESRVSLAEREKELAQVEVNDKICENESVKLIRIKEGFLKMSGAFMEMSHKCNTLFTAQRDIALQLPDVHGKGLEHIKYSGFVTTKLIVQQAKTKVTAEYNPTNMYNDEPPPPYMPPESNSHESPALSTRASPVASSSASHTGMSTSEPSINSPTARSSLSGPTGVSSSSARSRLSGPSGVSSPATRSSLSGPSDVSTPAVGSGQSSPAGATSSPVFSHTNIVQIRRESTSSVDSHCKPSPECPRLSISPGTSLRNVGSGDTEPPDYNQCIQDQGSSLAHLEPSASARISIASDTELNLSRPTPAPRQRRDVHNDEYDTAEEDCDAYLEEAAGGANGT